MQHTFTNRLVNENSPYLLQHAHNPVDWFAWGEEALSKAKKEDKVILVSIGYSACHWCHVMERESFENNEVAQIMNAHFVNIKIDREERPDLDHIYMDAVQAMSGSGGWPLNVFLTPEAKPFFGGTYFPPERAFNRSSWTEVLLGIQTAWQERKSEIESQAENLTNHLQNGNNFTSGLMPSDDGQWVTLDQCEQMFDAIMKNADREWGGFGNAPKFPQTFTIQYLLQYHHFTGNEAALQQALLSLDKMLLGGIYDHVDGGLARYSTDREWLAPHFEKMLYDNALLVLVLCDAYQITRNQKYEQAIRKTLLFISNELQDKAGGWYAALDADSEGEEGKYYVWQHEEIEHILGEDAKLFCDFFDVTGHGNWEEKNILRILVPVDDFAASHGLDKVVFESNIQRCLQKLSFERRRRVKPALDDKIILGWNALMLNAFAKAAVVLNDDGYRNVSKNGIEFISRSFGDNSDSNALFHTYKNGVAKYPAFLDDYAYLVAALLQMYRVSFDEGYLQKAKDYCTFLIENFSDEAGVFFYFTHKDQKDIIARKKEIYDGATPSGNSIMAENLLQLSVIFDQPALRNRADRMLQTLLPSIIKYPGSFAIWAAHLLQQVKGVNEIAVIGTDFATVTNKVLLNFIPNMIIMASGGQNNAFPLLGNKPAMAATLIYLCRNYSCLSPISDTDLLMTEISKTYK